MEPHPPFYPGYPNQESLGDPGQYGPGFLAISLDFHAHERTRADARTTHPEGPSHAGTAALDRLMLRFWLHNLPLAEGNAAVKEHAAPVRVCFVCLGNICRSPTAEGVFRHLVAEAGLASSFEIDSAGTAGYHSGDAPDRRARAAG